MNSAARARTRPKWWQWQPVTPAETLLYLLVMAVLSGLLAVLLNAVFAGGNPWAHFMPGAILSVVINAVTLWIKRHPRHAPRRSDAGG